MKKIVFIQAILIVCIIIGSCQSREKLASKSNQTIEQERTKPNSLLKSDILTVELKVTPVLESGKLQITGETNLPDQTELSLMLQLGDYGSQIYFAQSKAIVLNGNFKSEFFSDKGSSLKNGVYLISLGTPLSRFQPKSVQKIIGDKGQYLKGQYVVESSDILEGEKTVDFKMRYTIK